ncbi:MAG: hypothetical protein Fur003_1450 [Candidatus Dojkabacteria bacterium]
MNKLKGNSKRIPHIPMRTCIVTHEKLPKKELVRFVYIKETTSVLFDPSGKARGRGANLKASLEIFDKAVKSGAFSRAFKTRVDGATLNGLRNELEQYLEKKAFRGEKDKIVVRVKSDEKVKLD